MQVGIRTAIDELRLDIKNIEDQKQAKLSVYDDLVFEIMAKTEQRIKEVKAGVKI
jgi:hypothetical protein